MQLGVVDEDEAVVEVVGVGDGEALILAIEFRNLGRGRLAAILADEANGYARTLLRQHVKGRRVRIRVDDDDFRLRRLHEPRDIPQRIVLGTGGKKFGGDRPMRMIFALMKDIGVIPYDEKGDVGNC